MRKKLAIVDVTAGIQVAIVDTMAATSVYRWTAGQNVSICFSNNPVFGDRAYLYITCDGTARTVSFDNTLYEKSINKGSFVMIPSNTYELVFEFNTRTWVEVSRRNLTQLKDVSLSSWKYTSGSAGTSVLTPVIMQAAAVGVKNYIKSLQVSSASTTALRLDILDDTTVIASYAIAASMITPIIITFPDDFGASTNKNLNFQLSAAPTAGNVYINAQGYQNI